MSPPEVTVINLTPPLRRSRKSGELDVGAPQRGMPENCGILFQALVAPGFCPTIPVDASR